MPGLPVLHCLQEFVQTHVHWVNDAIQPSHPVTLFFSCPQSFPASGSFLMCQHFTSGAQSIGASTSASVLPMNIQGWFLLGLTGLINLLAKIILRAFSSIKFWKHLINSLALSLLYGPTLKSVHDYWKNHSFDYTTVLWRPTRSSRTNTQKSCPFHHRGLDCKSRKSRDIWSYRQIWPLSTKWNRGKVNRVLPRECIGHSKHLLPATQEITLHMTLPDG